MRKIITLLLCFTLIISGCAKKEEKKPEDKIPKEPPVLSSLDESILTLMGKIDLIPSINNAINERKKNEAIAEEKELKMQQTSEDRLPEKDRPQLKEEKEAKSIKISSFIEDAIIFNMLKAENIKSINELEKAKIPSKLEEAWMDVKKDLVKIHKSWNDLKSKMANVPVDKTSIDNFESNLTLLTDAVGKYDIINSLVYANNLTKSIGEFKNYFKSETNNEVDKMNYSIRKSVLLASSKNFDEASKTIDVTLESINSQGGKMYSKNKEAFLKVKYSLEDLKKAIQAKDMKLIGIKAPIAVGNIIKLKSIKPE